MQITITYCAPCKYKPQADAMVAEIASAFPDENVEFEIITGDSANFIIAVDGVRLFSKKHAKRWPVYREIPERITEILTQAGKTVN
jgi:selT/selW/selH-like putative selenoprotein